MVNKPFRDHRERRQIRCRRQHLRRRRACPGLGPRTRNSESAPRVQRRTQGTFEETGSHHQRPEGQRKKEVREEGCKGKLPVLQEITDHVARRGSRGHRIYGASSCPFCSVIPTCNSHLSRRTLTGGKRSRRSSPSSGGGWSCPSRRTDAGLQGRLRRLFPVPAPRCLRSAARNLFDGRALIIDLAAAFRFEDRALYEKTYGPHPAADLLPKAVYGLPEIHRQKLSGARLWAIRAVTRRARSLPFTHAQGRSGYGGRMFVDSKSGVSGAGREAKVGIPLLRSRGGLPGIRRRHPQARAGNTEGAVEACRRHDDSHPICCL